MLTVGLQTNCKTNVCEMSKNKGHWESFCRIRLHMFLMRLREIRLKSVPVINSALMLKMALEFQCT